MLFEKWSELVSRESGRVAVWDVGTNRTMTFNQLNMRAEECVQDDEIWRVDGNSPDFFPTLIAAWKHRRPVILMEEKRHRVRPILGKIPPGTVLIKQTCGASGVERSLFYGEAEVFAEGQRNLDGLGLHPGRPGLAAISLAHSYGFGCLALPLLLGGVPVHLVPAPLPMFMEKVLEQEEAIFLPGVPTLWKTWWSTGVTRHPAIELALSAGAPLSAELERGIFEDSGLKIHNFYGTSETGAIAYDSSSEPREHAGEVGQILPGISAECSSTGRVIVRSRSQAIGADVLLKEEEFAGAYETTDLGHFDRESLVLTGSCAGAANIAGRKVSLSRVKRILEELPMVVEAEVKKSTSPDFERFEEISTEVTVAEEVDKKVLRDALRSRLESWEVPRHWEIKQKDQSRSA